MVLRESNVNVLRKGGFPWFSCIIKPISSNVLKCCRSFSASYGVITLLAAVGESPCKERGGVGGGTYGPFRFSSAATFSALRSTPSTFNPATFLISCGV